MILTASITANEIWFIPTNVWNKFTTDPCPVLRYRLKTGKIFSINTPFESFCPRDRVHPCGCSLNSLKRVMRWKTNVIGDHRTGESNKFHRALFSIDSRGYDNAPVARIFIEFFIRRQTLTKNLYVYTRLNEILHGFTFETYIEKWKLIIILIFIRW